MTTTSAYVSTVNVDRTIELPEDIPIGAKVAIIVLPSAEMEEENSVRTVRFQRVMDAIQTAMDSDFDSPEISDHELNRLIHEARHAAST